MRPIHSIALAALAVLAALGGRAAAMDAIRQSVAGVAGAVAKMLTDAQMREQAKWAAGLSMQKDNFWQDAVSNARAHYTPHFGRKLADRFNEVHLKDQSPALVEFYEQLQEQVMQQGGRQFQDKVNAVRRVLGADRALAAVTQGYQVREANADERRQNGDWGNWWLHMMARPKTRQDFDDDLAKNVANWASGQTGPLSPIGDFAAFVAEHNPCRALERELAKPSMQEYAQYLALAALPDYYEHAPRAHRANANLLAACERLKSADVIAKAEHFYRVYYSAAD